MTWRRQEINASSTLGLFISGFTSGRRHLGGFVSCLNGLVSSWVKIDMNWDQKSRWSVKKAIWLAIFIHKNCHPMASGLKFHGPYPVAVDNTGERFPRSDKMFWVGHRSISGFPSQVEPCGVSGGLLPATIQF